MQPVEVFFQELWTEFCSSREDHDLSLLEQVLEDEGYPYIDSYTSLRTEIYHSLNTLLGSAHWTFFYSKFFFSDEKKKTLAGLILARR